MRAHPRVDSGSVLSISSAKSPPYQHQYLYSPLMVRVEHNRLVIQLHTENPEKELTELRKAITAVTTTLVVSDEWSFNPDLPEATASLIRLLGELVKHED